MDDMKTKIAARRAELSKLASEEVEMQSQLRRQELAAKVEAQAQAKIELKRQEEAAVDALAQELSTDEVKLVRDGEELAIVKSEAPPLDIEGLRKRKIDKLLHKEARKLWTPGQNWVVIGLIVGGLCLIPMGGFGLAPLILGFFAMRQVKKDCMKRVVDQYPDIFSDASNGSGKNPNH